MSVMRVEYFFDFSCPYAYLGSTQIEEICARNGATLVWKPMLLGGVFRSIGTPDDLRTAMSPGKILHNQRDMERWAARWSIPLKMPAAHPMRTVRALRALVSLPETSWSATIAALFRAYWVHGHDIASSEAVEAALLEAGNSPEAVARALAANDDTDIRTELRTRTDEAISRGVFGAPTMFVRDADAEHMMWGQDRLDLLESLLGGPVPPKPVPAPLVPGRTLDFFYDFSSPFAYLGATQVQAAGAAIGAELRYCPMLLGGLFRDMGTPDVPLLSMPTAKQSYVSMELERWAKRRQVPYRFSSHFPMNTVRALRLTLLSGSRIGEVTAAMFKAMWVDDEDLSDTATLHGIVSSCGLDADRLLDETNLPETKKKLRSITTAAAEQGVFGAPTFIVRDEAGLELYWGQDRLDLMVEIHRP